MRDKAVKLLPLHRRRERVLEQPDNASRALHVAGELFEQLRLGEAGRQGLRVKIGRDQHEGVMMRRSRRRAGTHIDALLRGADAADIFV